VCNKLKLMIQPKVAIPLTINIQIIAITVLMLSGCQAQPKESVPFDVSSEIVKPNKYIILKTTDAIAIDGKDDEDAWSEASFTEDFIDIEGIKIPKFRTRVKMLYDEINIYFFAELEEPKLAANLIKHDTVIFYDKDFEIFIDPTDDTYKYVELEVNAFNTTWDLFLDRPYRVDGKADDNFEFEGMKTAVAMNGTLNDDSDVDQSWTVEIAIPISSILKAGGSSETTVAQGDYWRMNFSRVHWDQHFIDGKYLRNRDDDGELQREYNWVWSNQKVINMHEPEKWGYVFFSSSALDAAIDYPIDYLDKQVTYTFWRNTRRNGALRYIREKPAGFIETFETFRIDNHEYEVKMAKSKTGYMFDLINLTTLDRYRINEAGWIDMIDSK